MSGGVIGVLTSGTDAQGVNAVIRSVVRTGLFLGCKVMFIKDGLKGLVENKIDEARWSETQGTESLGGTILGSQKCPEFKNYIPRRTAGLNLIKAGISNVIFIGGEGTLKAARSLFSDWGEIVKDLLGLNLITLEMAHQYKHLHVVCLIASVEHDVVGTDISIGTNTAVHRITEALDNIAVTHTSCNQAFVVEVLGSESGFLALVSGLAYHASMVFIPEWPAQGDWVQELKNKMTTRCKRGLLIIAASGAIDRQGKPIKVNDIANVLKELGMDTRITVLGHVQRGGLPSVFDRFNGIRIGADAVTCLHQLPDDQSAICAVGLRGTDIVTLDVDKVIDDTERVASCIRSLNFVDAVRLKGERFQRFLSAYNMTQTLKPAITLSIPGCEPIIRKIGVVKLGQTSLGVCWTVKTLVNTCESKGFRVVGFRNGLEGVARDWALPLSSETVRDWTVTTAGRLGTSERSANAVGLDRIEKGIAKHNLSGLVLIGEFPAYVSLHEMWEGMREHSGLCIPVMMIPVATNNNIPNTDFCIGADTATNEIVEYCSKLKRVAAGRGKTVFVVETLGSHSEYLTTMCGLCAGADVAYTRRTKLTLDKLLDDANMITEKILDRESPLSMGFIIKSQNASDNYTLDIIQNIFNEEGRGIFNCNTASIGDVQMGSTPTPFDRVLAHCSGLEAGCWMVEQILGCVQKDRSVYTVQPTSKCVMCSCNGQLTPSPISELALETDFLHQLPKYMWWSQLTSLMRVLSRHYKDTDTTNTSLRVNYASRHSFRLRTVQSKTAYFEPDTDSEKESVKKYGTRMSKVSIMPKFEKGSPDSGNTSQSGENANRDTSRSKHTTKAPSTRRRSSATIAPSFYLDDDTDY